MVVVDKIMLEYLQGNRVSGILHEQNFVANLAYEALMALFCSLLDCKQGLLPSEPLMGCSTACIEKFLDHNSRKAS